jgi:hypothetical protein
LSPSPSPAPTTARARQRGTIAFTAAGAAALGLGAVLVHAVGQPRASDPVLAWNAIGIEAGAALERGTAEQRELAMMHLAIHDALNSIVPVYASYAPMHARHPQASPAAAVATAAHDVLVATVPMRRSELDADYADALAGRRDGIAKQEGIAAGREAARAIVAMRAGDGADRADVRDTGARGIGRWEPTPPNHLPALLPGWQFVQPFALASPAQFLPPPPPDLRSAEYARQFNAVRLLGREVGSARTEAQSETARFWAGNVGDAWNDIARAVVAQRPDRRDALATWRNARAFALLNMAMADGFVSGWHAKYRYRAWRPVTAIPRAALDGNPATAPDLQWTSLLPTPEHPEYPSTHSVLSAAAAATLHCSLGTDAANVDIDSRSKYTSASRHVASFSQAAQEIAMSRLYAGAHFPVANTNGLKQGRRIGEYACARYLRPRG